ncbi:MULTISPECIES: enoyl-CoA hydratase-related protein [unclassified Streptomyces]|uniref:enoyl-CoA hydratase-related protein n=1 Tax=unclassified Streptomyces TaxID=2593676 RepID=UPI00143C314D|nr:enoyl-CoA hydratase-related protein [Streptomyces sp. NEAU-H3]NJA60154.1 enoyl-CoA hydratase/isomerase family protein [Streptomyces sp. NEAU-H3]
MPELTRDGDVFVLRLDADSENLFHPGWLGAVERALDEVEAAEGPCALVTAGEGKYWSNGLDLAWLMAHGDQYAAYLDRVHALLARTLASRVVTVAALTGHTFAAGAMWALAHDVRVMRADRGWFCLPEVDLGLPFQPGMTALIRSRLTPATAHEAMTTGRRYPAPEALASGLVDAVAAADEVVTEAVTRARALAPKAVPVRAEIKEGLYAEALAALRTATKA